MKQSLSDLQRWFQDSIRRPRHAVDESELHRLILPSQRLSAPDRLAVYANAYFARLVDCLRDMFPIMVRWLGAELFDSFAIEYLKRFPSQSYTLDHLGSRFEQYLRQTRPPEVAERWPDFLAELAAMEWAINEIFDGPGAESLPSFPADQLRTLSSDQFLSARLRINPALRLMAFDFPVNAFFSAARQAPPDQELTPPDPQSTWLALSRRQYVVRRRDLDRAQSAMLGSLMQGSPVGSALESAAEFLDGDDAHLAHRIQSWFADWSAEGYFTAIQF